MNKEERINTGSKFTDREILEGCSVHIEALKQQNNILEIKNKNLLINQKLISDFRKIEQEEIAFLNDKLMIAKKAIECALSSPIFPDDKMFELMECKVGYCIGLAEKELQEGKE